MLSYRAKMILKIIGLLAIVVGLGVIVVLAFFRGGPQISEPETPTTPVTADLPGSITVSPGDRAPTRPETETSLPASEIADGGPTFTSQLTSSSIISPTLANGSQINFYDQRDGKFYTINNNGEIVPLSEVSFPGAIAVEFSDTADVVTIEFPDGSNIIYDFVSETQTTLPVHWEDFQFTEDGSQIASKSIGTTADNTALVVSSRDGSRTEVVTALGNNADKVSINWSPTNEIVAFSQTSQNSTFGANEIYIIDANGEDVGRIVVSGSKFSAIWSPNSTHILYSISDPEKERPQLWLTKASGTEIGGDRRQFAIETWVEKCTFKDAAIVYCAVPQEMVDYAGYDHSFVTSNDDLYEVNVSTGRVRMVGSPATGMQMFNLNLSDDGSIMYFTDKYGRLNSMRIR